MLNITEIFYSLQGESTFAGLPCIFVRLSGCRLHCVWCDTDYAREASQPWTMEKVIRYLAQWDCRLVEITGGEPLLQSEVFDLMRQLCDLGYEVLLETSGSEDIALVDARVHRIMDIKCPGSGMNTFNRWDNLALLTHRDQIKMIVADRADYEWARDLIRHRTLNALCPVLMAPAFGRMPLAALAKWILEDSLPVRYQLQIHKFIWPADSRGV